MALEGYSPPRCGAAPVHMLHEAAKGTPGFPGLHYLPEFAQTHVHRVNDAIQPSHPLSSPSPPALNLSQHQGFPNESALRIR